MRRSTFLVLYVAGVLLQQFANPWVVLGRAAVSPEQLGLADLVTVCMPVLLVAIAVLRGQAIGWPRLYLWPAAALVMSGLPFFIGWSLLLATHRRPDWSSVPGPFGAMLGLVAIGIPLLLHVACCLRATQDSVAFRSAA